MSRSHSYAEGVFGAGASASVFVRLPFIAVCALAMALTLAACAGTSSSRVETGADTEQVTEAEGEVPSEDLDVVGERFIADDVKLIMDAVGVEEDAALGTAQRLCEIGVGQLVSAEEVSSDGGHVVKVTDEYGRTYFVGLNKLGYVDIIRFDSVDGEVLYGAVE